jgi:hypothetical protein
VYPFIRSVGLLAMLNQLPDLDQLRDHNRVLLIFGSREEAPQVAHQREEFAKHKRGTTERDLKIFVVAGESQEALGLRKRFGASPSDPLCVVLIGKDGGRKMRRSGFVPADDVFRLIDTMPMRKAEMRDRD